ncbi:MAG TPA: sugar phosphate nucleotidyltransferase [Bryobacteraceae bacterium]|nr:sugar phosphate nucleotidyltransferase [Bryobacteraceae bacterium]
MPIVEKAIVLAAGRGTRMGTLTADLPNPMLPVDGRPMLEHILERLSKAGIRRVLLVVGYRRETIIEHFAGYEALDIEYAVQETPTGTGSAVALGREFAGSDPCLLTFGDIICEPTDYAGLVNMFAECSHGVLGAKHVDDPWQGAAIYEERGIIQRIVEKPARGTSSTHWNSAGLYVFAPVLFRYLDRLQMSPRGEYELTSAIADMIADGQKLRLYALEGRWRDVGRPEDLQAAADIVDD